MRYRLKQIPKYSRREIIKEIKSIRKSKPISNERRYYIKKISLRRVVLNWKDWKDIRE
jgi:hypothetical protein